VLTHLGPYASASRDISQEEGVKPWTPAIKVQMPRVVIYIKMNMVCYI
jgi:hypothetical protein